MCIPYGQTTIGVLSKVKQNVLNDFINTVCQCCMSFFFNWFITQTVYTKCTKISYKTVPATNFTTYVLINKWKRIVWLRIEVEITTVKNDRLIEAVHSSYVCMGCVWSSDWPKCNSVAFWPIWLLCWWLLTRKYWKSNDIII